MEQLNHYTLNTSHGRLTDRSEVAAEVWRGLTGLADQFEIPHSDRQPPLPWLSVVLLPIPMDRDTAFMLADLERCLAWTMIEHE